MNRKIKPKKNTRALPGSKAISSGMLGIRPSHCERRPDHPLFPDVVSLLTELPYMLRPRVLCDVPHDRARGRDMVTAEGQRLPLMNQPILTSSKYQKFNRPKKRKKSKNTTKKSEKKSNQKQKKLPLHKKKNEKSSQKHLLLPNFLKKKNEKSSKNKIKNNPNKQK